MIKNTILLLAVIIFFSGCVNKEMLKEQIAQAIKENPQIVLNAMRENSLDMLEIVESGIDKREKIKREAQFEAEINNPYKPSLNPVRASLGSSAAPVTIVEYTDFLCPYCRKGAAVVRKLVAEHPEKYRLIFRNLPMHDNSRQLAAVFEAIALIDMDKAFEFHDFAFEKQRELYNDKKGIVLGQILDQVGVDYKKLQEKLNSEEVKNYLKADEKEAREFGLDATPTFIINGVSVRGYMPADKFEHMVDLILEKSTAANTDDGEICEDCLNQQ